MKVSLPQGRFDVHCSKLEHELGKHVFIKIAHTYPTLTFFKPSEKAPWHIQAELNGQLLNFWPTKNRASIEGEKAVEGYKAICAKIDEAANENPDDWNPIDEGDIGTHP